MRTRIAIAILLAFAVICAMFGCANKHPDTPPPFEATPESLPTTGATPATVTPSETPTVPTPIPTAALDVPLVYTTLDATPTALAVLDDSDIAELLVVIELADLPAMQGFYYSLSGEGYEWDIYAYLEIGGVRYELGMVAYGDANPEQHSLHERSLMTDGTQSGFYELVRSLGANYMQCSYYVVENGVPLHIIDIDRAYVYEDIDGDGVYEILASYGTASFDQHVYKFDLENETVYFASLAKLLGCDAVYYDTEQQVYRTFSWESGDGAQYVLKDGVFVAK